MLPDSHPAVQAELDRRMSAKAKAAMPKPEVIAEAKVKPKKKTPTTGKTPKDKDDADTLENDTSGKWRATHQQLAESRLLVELRYC